MQQEAKRIESPQMKHDYAAIAARPKFKSLVRKKKEAL